LARPFSQKDPPGSLPPAELMCSDDQGADFPVTEQSEALNRERDVESYSDQTCAVGAIANGHVLAEGLAGFVSRRRRITLDPWRPGEVVNGHAFTGDA
jgi:hypothetical protein